MHTILRISALFSFVLLALFGPAQVLKRPASFGFQPAPLDEATAKAKGLNEAQGLLVMRVLPGSTFAELGVQEGDVVRSINQQATHDWNGLVAAKQDLWGGDPIAVEIWREGKRKVLKGKAGAKARETSERWEVRYDAVPFGDGHLSGIVTKPKGKGPFPTVYFIPGYTCATVDNLSPIHPYRKVLDSLSGLGYAVFRVDKPGMGEGPNPCQCMETGFRKELEVFRAGWKHLQQYDFVDQEQIFMFGHSMGGFEAPLLAAEEGIQPRGIAVYGTAFQSWYEYIIAMLRFQEPRTGEDYLTFEADMAEYTRLFYEHYVLHKPLAEIITNPTWKGLLERDFALNADGDILYRKSFFWRELSEISVGAAWTKVDAHVLSIYGEADFEVFNPFSMQEIARIINARHPGKGKFISLDGTNHSMIQVGSMDKEVELKGSPAYRDYLVNHFDWRVVDALHEWMQEVASQP